MRGGTGVPRHLVGGACDTHRMYEAVLAVFLRVQHAVFDEHRDRPQDERHKQVHVDEVACAVQLPAHRTGQRLPGGKHEEGGLALRHQPDLRVLPN